MPLTLRATASAAASAPFIAHHGLSSPAAGDALVLGDAFAEGGFGTVHPVQSVSGRVPGRKLVAKLFDADVLANTGGSAPVIASTRDLHEALARKAPHRWPDALLALAYVLLEADVGGQATLVSLMLDLREFGHEEAPFADLANVPAYLSRPPRDRIEIAVRLCERAMLLETVGLLHGDLNPENLLVHPATLDVQIIDFDAGVIVATGQERPRTAGKPDDCMPPEVKVVGAGIAVDLQRYTPEAERWSIGSLVGYCLFGAHPGFFLRSISRAAIEGYARDPGDWPEIDVNGPLFTKHTQNQRAYLRMRSDLQALPSGAQTAFKRFFAAGLDGARRPTAAEWHDALSSLREAPRIDHVVIDRLFVVEGGTVVLEWKTRNATHVELTPGGRQLAAGRLTLAIDAATFFEVKAVNAYGATTDRTPVVRVMPLPRIERVLLQPFPDLSFSTPIALVPAPAGATTQVLDATPPPTLRPLFRAIGPEATVTGVVPAPNVGALFRTAADGALPAFPPFPDLSALFRRPGQP